jgi:peroxiredoxin
VGNLTGDYQAVLHLSVRQLNGILATLHQRRVDPAASPTFPHAVRVRIGNPPRTFDAGSLRYRSWTMEAAKALNPAAGAPIAQTRQLVSGSMPPGVSAMFANAWDVLDQSVIEPAPPGTVRGWADVQLSNPTVSFPPGVDSAVVLHVWVRARFEPDFGAASLLVPIHGEVRALYTVRPITLGDGRRVLRVRASSDDGQIQFISAAPVSAAQQLQIALMARAALREQFVPVDVDLDPGFAFAEFKGIGSGPAAAVVLPVQLTGGPAPAGGLGGVTSQVLGSSEFAIAVGKEFVQTFVDQAAAVMRQAAAARQFSALGATYTVSASAIAVTWKSGAFDLSGTIHARTPSWWAPNGFVTFTQSLAVALHAPSQTVSLVPLGDPEVDESWFIPHSTALNAVRSARDSALPGASIQVNASFKGALDALAAGLREFDPSASARYTGVEVTPDGIIARGEIGTSGRLAPVVHAVELGGGAAYSAFHSWIPGGRIERFEWTWVEGEVWASHIESVSDEHAFVCPRPAGLKEASRICLRIHGSVTESSGHVNETVVAGEVCTPSWFEPILTVPPWWIEAIVPLWLPRWPELTLNEQVAGHVSALGETRVPGSITPNTLVHFTGPRLEQPLEALGRALAGMRRANLSLLVVVVLPSGTFEQPAREVEARLGSPGERFAGRLVVTEDFAGGWARTFAATGEASTHLINARGEFVWAREGPLEGEVLARALDEHALDAPPPRSAPLRLAVQPGEAAPDLHFRDGEGNPIALRRLRGRRVLLVFWQSWSAPCLRQLRQLQAGQERGGGPLIFAINGGEDPEVLDAVRRQHGLALPLIPDPGRLIATAYGVRCWPTAVSINQEGIVDRIQLGLADGPRGEPARAGA